MYIDMTHLKNRMHSALHAILIPRCGGALFTNRGRARLDSQPLAGDRLAGARMPQSSGGDPGLRGRDLTSTLLFAKWSPPGNCAPSNENIAGNPIGTVRRGTVDPARPARQASKFATEPAGGASHQRRCSGNASIASRVISVTACTVQ